MNVFCIFYLLLQVQSPINPTEPQVKEPSVEDIKWPEVELKRWNLPTNTSSQLHLFQIEVNLYGYTNRYRGLWKLHRSPVIILTNTLAHTIQEISFSLYDVKRIEMISWKINKISNTWYEFIPNEVRYILRNGKTNQGKSDFSWLWSIPLEQDEKKWTGYTLFYDSWEKGEGQRFRWRHAQFPHFHHHFTIPVKGTIIAIDFLYPYP